jgi:hypothetical protein
LEDLDKLLLDTIDEVLRYILGDKSTDRFIEYLEGRSCLKNEIPSKLDVFSNELRNTLSDKPYGGRFTDGISGLGKAAIVERAIARLLYRKLGIDFKEAGPINLSLLVPQLKRTLSQDSNEVYSEVEEAHRIAQAQRVQAIGDEELRTGWFNKYFGMIKVSPNKVTWINVPGTR